MSTPSDSPRINANEYASSNYAKFRTRNPIVRRLIDRFYATLFEVLRPLKPSSLLDVGCGEGETLERLGADLPERVVAVDANADAVGFTGRRLPGVNARVEDVNALSFPDSSFDLILCLEVLEHLEQPRIALAELARVSRRDVVVSVPHEPYFRLGSLARGKYVRHLGNHPEHVQHWNRRTLPAFLGEQLEVRSVASPAPWLIAHGQIGSSAARESRRAARSGA